MVSKIIWKMKLMEMRMVTMMMIWEVADYVPSQVSSVHSEPAVTSKGSKSLISRFNGSTSKTGAKETSRATRTTTKHLKNPVQSCDIIGGRWGASWPSRGRGPKGSYVRPVLYMELGA